MRLFIAAELPEPMLEALAETTALLRSSVHGRFVASDSLHVTLAFLGNVSSYRIDDIADAIEAGCIELLAARATLGQLGSFGKRSRATLWQGFDDVGPLVRAANNVRNELRKRDFTFDAKKFLPHVTLMRNADLSSGELPAPVIASGFIESVTLFSSDLSGTRPVYDPLHTTVLKKR